MNNFKDINQLNNAFIAGHLSVVPSFEVNDKKYTQIQSSTIQFEQLLSGKKGIVVYESEQKDIIALYWAIGSNLKVVPFAVVQTQKDAIVVAHNINETQSKARTINPNQLIGDIVTVKFIGLPNSQQLEGKVDTGATICSLHAEDYTIRGDIVEFSCPPLSDNKFSMPLKTQHAVKSPDGGIVYRPVIELSVKINDCLLNNIMFNLNDRAHMDHPVLVGMNALEKGGFLIDPTIKEQIDWDKLEALEPTDTTVLNATIDEELLNQLYEQLLKSNITFADLIRHIRTEVIKTFEDIKY